MFIVCVAVENDDFLPHEFECYWLPFHACNVYFYFISSKKGFTRS